LNELNNEENKYEKYFNIHCDNNEEDNKEFIESVTVYCTDKEKEKDPLYDHKLNVRPVSCISSNHDHIVVGYGEI